MFIVRHTAYVDHPVAMSRAMIRAILVSREIGYVLSGITHTCGGQIQKSTEKKKINNGDVGNRIETHSKHGQSKKPELRSNQRQLLPP